MCGTCSKVQHCSEGMEHKLFEDTQLNQIEPTGARVPDNLNICVTLVQDALVGHSCATLFLRRSSIKLLWANQIQPKTVDGNGTQTKLRLWAGKKHLEHFQLIALRHCNVDGNIGPFKTGGGVRASWLGTTQQITEQQRDPATWQNKNCKWWMVGEAKCAVESFISCFKIN